MWNPVKPITDYLSRGAHQTYSVLTGLPVDWSGRLWGKTTASQRNLDKFWKYYAENEVVWSATRETVEASSQIPMYPEQYQGARYMRMAETDPLSQRLQNPNPRQDAVSFGENMDTQLVVTGNAIIAELDSDEMFGPLEVLPTNKVWVETDKQTGWPVRYWYDPEKRGGGPMMAPFNKPSKNALSFELNRIIHRTYAPDPSVPWWGLGPYSAALDAIEADVEITLYIRQFFKHGAVPPYMLLYEEELTNEQERQIQTRWDRNVAGSTDQAWKIGVMGGGGKATLQRMGLAAGSREVGLQDLRDSTETRILVALNVPPIVVGVRLGIESMTYSNYGQARQAMHEENTDPLTRKRTSAFTAYYRRRTGNPLLRISNDLTDVLAVQDRLREKSEWATRELQGGVAMQNEARGKAGYPPTPNGDVFFIPLNLMPSDGSLITQERVSELAAIHRDYEATKRVVREQAFVSAQSVGLAIIPEALLTQVLSEVAPKGESESKRQFATRVLMLTHSTVQSFAHHGGKQGA